MISEILVCPKCGSWDVNQTKSRSHLRNFLRLMSDKKLYLCEDCGWRGYIIRARKLPLALAIGSSIIAILIILMVLLR
jgi:hypothetical protein